MMRTRTLRVVGLAVLLCLLVGGGAFAAKAKFKTGTYQGGKATAVVKLVKFKATKTAVKSLEFSLRKVGGCANGQNLVDTQDGYDIDKIKIKKGKFTGHGTFTGSTGATAKFTLKGKLKEKKASGTLRTVVNLVAGNTTCDSGKATWKANRIGK